MTEIYKQFIQTALVLKELERVHMQQDFVLPGHGVYHALAKHWHRKREFFLGSPREQEINTAL